MDSLALTDPLRLLAGSGRRLVGHLSPAAPSHVPALLPVFGVSAPPGKPCRISIAGAGSVNSVMPSSTSRKDGVYTVGDFMTPKEHLIVVKPTTTVDEALETLVEYKITGFPVIDDDWKLVGVVSDYDLLAVDSISGTGTPETGLFPAVDSNWNKRKYKGTPVPVCFRRKYPTFNELQRLLCKTNGKTIADVMTPAPLVVRENSNLEDATRLLLKTKYRRLPVVDRSGNLVGIITRGNVVNAALQIKRENER